ncbi:MAG: right-handed parallel beta-helix repeat-containing protein [Bacteroidota bacterium]
MKRIALLLLVLCTHIVHASTTITTPDVYGHWTLAGSPYLIANDVYIPGDKVLVIDPGVDVMFMGMYSLEVDGALYAVGNAIQTVKFHAENTTQWNVDTVDAGGWHGIQFLQYSGINPDSSAMQYCEIADTKDGMGWISAKFTVKRALQIKNCSFYHNQSHNAIIQLVSDPSYQIEMSGCSISNNTSYAVVQMISSGFMPGYSYIHDNKLFSNTNTQGVINCMGSNALIENNQIYQNISKGNGAAITVAGNEVTLRGNMIHHNNAQQTAAINCAYGIVDMNMNLISNNQDTSSVCSAAYGGGAIRIDNDSSGISTGEAAYTVRNNIIANNYSAQFGGGIYVAAPKCNIEISNNDIVNNKTNLVHAGGISVSADTSNVVMKNNVFFANVTGSQTASSSISVDIWGQENTLRFAYNWIHKAFYVDVNILAGVICNVYGDTNTNLIGPNPNMVSPTLTSNVTEDATTANFYLLSTSACVNSGDVAFISPYATDYAGNNRIFGGVIDIGAYEYSFNSGIGNTSTATQTLNVYPNPASQMIHVSVPEAKGVIILQDVTGRVLYQETVTNTLNTIDIHSLATGMYLMTWDKGTTEKSVQKVVVQ